MDPPLRKAKLLNATDFASQKGAAEAAAPGDFPSDDARDAALELLDTVSTAAGSGDDRGIPEEGLHKPEVGPSNSHPSLSAYTRARGMDHSALITLNANQGTRRAIKRCPPMRAVAKPSKPKLAPRSQKWPLGHRRSTMPRCATATVPTASHTSQASISTTHPRRGDN